MRAVLVSFCLLIAGLLSASGHALPPLETGTLRVEDALSWTGTPDEGAGDLVAIAGDRLYVVHANFNDNALVIHDRLPGTQDWSIVDRITLPYQTVFDLVASNDYVVMSGSGSIRIFDRDANELAELLPAEHPTQVDGGPWTLAIDGDIVVAGSPSFIWPNFGAGNAYLWEKPAGGWQTLRPDARLIPSDAATLGIPGQFGFCVGVDADTVVVGSPTPTPGHAYVFERPGTQWVDTNEVAKLFPGVGGVNDFGQGCDIDGGRVLVAQPFGSFAWIFEEPAGGWSGTVAHSAKLEVNNAPQVGSGFGPEVAMDGSLVAIGAPENDTPDPDAGVVFLYEEPPGGFSGIMNESALLHHALSSDPLPKVGGSVSVSDGVVATNAATSLGGAGLIFDEPGPGWSGAPTESARQLDTGMVPGSVDGVDVEGDLLALQGSPQSPISQFFLFERASNGFEWSYASTLITEGSVSGLEVQIGNGFVLSGVSIFEEPAGGWPPMLEGPDATLPSGGVRRLVAGDLVAQLVDDGNLRVDLYQRPPGGWASGTPPFTPIATLEPAASVGDVFNRYGLAMREDRVVVGASSPGTFASPGLGRAYVFDRPPGGWLGVVNESAILWPSDAVDGDFFGLSVAMEGDVVVVGSDRPDSPRAYLFEEGATPWSFNVTQTAVLEPSTGTTDDSFGHALAIAENRVAVGAPRFQPAEHGAVFLYERPASGWSGALNESAFLQLPPEALTNLGAIVDLDGAQLMAATDRLAPDDDLVLWSLTTRCALSGVAAGGSVSATISGEPIWVTTTAGENPDDVASAFAAAILADANLAALGVTAVASGGLLETTGHVANVTVTDPGLGHVLLLPEPGAGPALVAGLAALARLRRRRASWR